MSNANGVIVTGAEGQLGRQIVARLRACPNRETIGYDRRQWDITDADRTREILLSERPKWLINTAAFTQVDLCESHTDAAIAVNGKAVAHLAAACNETNTTLLQVSTDYVFNGTLRRPYREDDSPDPINAYGRSKLLGEQHARTARRHLIVRTSWMYGAGGRNFVDTILNKATAGDTLRVVNDQTGSPSYAGDVAESIERLLSVGASGTVHIANSGEATWYDVARLAIELAAAGVSVEPISSDEYQLPARRPRYTVLNCDRYIALTEHTPRPWTSALQEYVQDREQS